MEELTREEFNSWKENKVTQIVIKALSGLQNQLKDHLSAGGTLAGDGSAEVQTAATVGRIQGLNDFLLVDYDDTPKENREDYDH
jgi:hypothetical protein